jgi:DNA-directed RNA polymerase
MGIDDRDATLRAAMEQIGTAIERECRSARPRLLRKKAEGYARLNWDVEQLHQAGAWGVDMLLRAVPAMFELVTVGRDNYLVLSAKAQDLPDEILWTCVRNNPHHVPTLERPKPWTSDTRDGAWGERQRLVRCRPNSMRMDAVRKALARKPKPWLDALHKLESAPYRINEHMLRFVQRSYELATAGNPRGLGFLFHENTIRAWRWDRETKKRHNAIIANAGDRNNGGETAFRIDMMTAKELLNSAAFYVPMNFDTRGRVYALPSFNFTRGDHIRCLFDFDESKPIGERGLYWLKVHVANCAAGFDKSRPGELTFEERAQWVDDHADELTGIGRSALESAEVDEALLSGVDDRFQFVRACIELYRADGNPQFESRLPLLFDATSSGLQHYCLLMRDETGGRLVNLVPGLPPQDAYKTISEDMALEQTDDLKEVLPGLYAAYPKVTQAQVVAGALGRKLTKGPAVTRFYGRKDEKHARQLLRDHKWMRNWTGRDQIDPVAEALIRSMNRVFPRPAQAMQFVQRVTRQRTQVTAPDLRDRIPLAESLSQAQDQAHTLMDWRSGRADQDNGRRSARASSHQSEKLQRTKPRSRARWDSRAVCRPAGAGYENPASDRP